jgi:hypothetical protein
MTKITNKSVGHLMIKMLESSITTTKEATEDPQATVNDQARSCGIRQ